MLVSDLRCRMHEQIAQFPSRVMYGSKLKAHPSVASHLLRDLPNVAHHANGHSKEGEEDAEKEVLETPVVFFDTAGCEYFERTEGDGDEGSKCNENEATVVRKWVEQLVSLTLFWPSLALAPFSLHTHLLRSKAGFCHLKSRSSRRSFPPSPLYVSLT